MRFLRGCGSVGRASPCQGEGRGFESRHPLANGNPSFSCVARWVGREARQRPAKPYTRVRIPYPPRAIGAGVARFLHTEEVTGSIPVSPTTQVFGVGLKGVGASSSPPAAQGRPGAARRVGADHPGRAPCAVGRRPGAPMAVRAASARRALPVGRRSTDPRGAHRVRATGPARRCRWGGRPAPRVTAC